MKTSLLVMVGVMWLTSCKREPLQSQLTFEQLQAVQNMESSYVQAKAYNDTLIRIVTSSSCSSDTVRIHNLDQMYHNEVAAFENVHHHYEHTNNSADHSHNTQGMVQMHTANNSMMGRSACGCCTNGGHTAGIHEQMDELYDLHAPYHPHP